MSYQALPGITGRSKYINISTYHIPGPAPHLGKTMDNIRNLKLSTKGLLKESILGAFYTLWTAPIDSPKLSLPVKKTARENLLGAVLNNLIIGQSS